MTANAAPAAGATSAAQFGAGAYRPSARLARRIRARDRRCRFPGCTVAAVFCDLDHVRPWPTGPTTATNLLYLCRRHHRVKQRPGWHLTLRPDGQATWVDPTGMVRTTDPVDALHPLVLPDTTTPTPAGAPGQPDTSAGPEQLTGTSSTSTARVALSDGPHSDLEFTLEHHAAALARTTTTTTWRDGHGRRHHTDLVAVTDLQDPHGVEMPYPDDPNGYGHPTHRPHSPGRSERFDPRDPWARWHAASTRRRRRAAHRDNDPPPF